MIVELKEKLKPNTFLYWDGKQIVSIDKNDLLAELRGDVDKLKGFQQSILERQKTYEEKLNLRFKKFLSIFKRGDK